MAYGAAYITGGCQATSIEPKRQGGSEERMDRIPIVVIGASAGGIEALTRLASALPATLPAALFVVQHLYPHSDSHLALLLDRAGALAAQPARDGQTIEPGQIYVAPPNFHLLLNEPVRITLSSGPRENRHRPAIDALFRTAARTYGSLVSAVLLTGTLDDGVAGLMAVKMRGGRAIVQDPDDAAFSELPLNALSQVAGIDQLLSLADIPSGLAQWVEQISAQLHEAAGMTTAQAAGHRNNPGGANERMSHSAYHAVRHDEQHDKERDADNNLSDGRAPKLQAERQTGLPSGYICPDCGGALWEVQNGQVTQYICRVGHAYGFQSLVAAQDDVVEEALWTAVHALREQAELAERMAERVEDRPLLRTSSEEYRSQARRAREHSQVIQHLIYELGQEPGQGTEADR
jgi:two-component system chemotaxis response regulator CheB